MLERGGGRNRPQLRVRIDHAGDSAGRSPVTVEDCAAVTRAVRELLEAEEDATSWVLEISSPGVERPLVKASDYARFAGERVRVRGFAPLANRRKQLDGTLLGLVDGTPEAFALDVGGERVEIPLVAVAAARLVYEWNGKSDSDRAKT